MQYNLEYHKQLDRSHILPNILEGAKTGVASQFLSDVIISLLLFNESIVLEDIKISTVPSYYASVATGMLAGFLIIYLDPIAVIALTIVFYDYVFEIVDYHINDDPIQVTPVEDVFDIGLTRFIEPTLGRQDRSPTIAIFITVLTSTYNFLKIQSDQEENSVITQETMQ